MNVRQDSGRSELRNSSAVAHLRGTRRFWVLALAVLTIVLTVPARRVKAQNASPDGAPDSGFQLAQPVDPGQTSPHLTITLQDALDRAEKNDAQFSAAVTDAKLAREDHVQMRAAGLPSVVAQTSALLTQGDGTLSEGRYVTNDGVHVYRQWGVVHQEFSLSTMTMLGDRRGAALEAQARARQEIARRGLKVTVTKYYYALVVSQRKYATAQEAMQQAGHFLQMTKDQENAGEAAHSDVIKAQIQYNLQQAGLRDAQLQMENDRLTLAVLLFPSFDENYSVVDDLEQGPALPPFADAKDMAMKQNPDLRLAMEALRETSLGVVEARSALLPSVSTDLDYGIEANRFAFRSVVSAFPEKGPLPNLGYFATITLNLPVWDWGSLRSKLKQAEYQREQARVELTSAQRQTVSELYSVYNEAGTAKSTMETLRQTADLANEEMRLTNLRYQAGQSSALEVVDAQNTLAQARNAYADGLARYRVALAELQTLTGSF